MLPPSHSPFSAHVFAHFAPCVRLLSAAGKKWRVRGGFLSGLQTRLLLPVNKASLHRKQGFFLVQTRLVCKPAKKRLKNGRM